MRTHNRAPSVKSSGPVTAPRRPILPVRWSSGDPDRHPRLWSPIPWHPLRPLERTRACASTRCRLLAARDGLHVRIACTASVLTATMRNDGDPLYLQDVVEIFLWPDPSDDGTACYLEHEVSPAGRCLTLIVASNGKPQARWTPWGLDTDSQPRQRVKIRRKRGRIVGWDVAVVLPWRLFAGLGVTPPAAGTCWRGNITRIDHGQGVARHAAWSLPTEVNFHQLSTMGIVRFDRTLPQRRRTPPR